MGKDVIEKMGDAMDSVQLWVRTNDLLTPPAHEICRYGNDDEPEIVVLETMAVTDNPREALHKIVSRHRANAAARVMLEDMREFWPTDETLKRAPMLNFHTVIDAYAKANGLSRKED